MNIKCNKVIECVGISKYYRKKVIDGFNYIFEKGKIYIVNSSNGSGKTTLIKLILNVIKPTYGYVKINTQNIIYIPDKCYLPETITVINYLKLMFEYHGIDITYNEIIFYLKIWEIEKYYDYKINKLSKGTKQKVLLISQIYTNSSVYVLDEVFNGLDKESQKKLVLLLNKYKEEGKTIIIISHLMALFKNIEHEVIDLDYE